MEQNLPSLLFTQIVDNVGEFKGRPVPGAVIQTGSQDLGPKWVRLAPNENLFSDGTNPRIFSDQIKYILTYRAKIY